MTTVLPAATTCPHCGLIHATTCSRIKAIEYRENGTVKRVEFHGPQPLVAGAIGVTPPQTAARGYWPPPTASGSVTYTSPNALLHNTSLQ